MTATDALIDRIFLSVMTIVAAFVAWRPLTFFRILSYGKFREGDVAPGLLRSIRVIAVVVAASAIFYLAGGAAWLAK